MFTKRNKAEDESPCAIIIIIAPFIPIVLNVNKLAKINPIWATEEYATKDFKSFCRIQFILVIVAPISLILIIQGLKFLILIKSGITRMSPYPPNFSKTAAKIIDPSNGASTWALGSHRWKINIGIFTRNAKINIIGKLIEKQEFIE